MSKNEVAVSVLNVDSEGAISLFYKLETAKEINQVYFNGKCSFFFKCVHSLSYS